MKYLFVLLLMGGLGLSEPLLAQDSPWDKGTVTVAQPLKITVYHSPSCGCCGGWVEHLKKNGFAVTDIKTEKVGDVKVKYGVPAGMGSCHTALVNGYVIEGHVPADDIKRLVKQKSTAAGLAVPGMPTGGPGMEMGDRKDPFDVIAFSRDGKERVFNSYRKY